MPMIKCSWCGEDLKVAKVLITPQLHRECKSIYNSKVDEFIARLARAGR